MIFIPEIALYNILNGCLTFVRDNYTNTANKNQTILAEIFLGNTDHKRDYYKDAVALIMKESTDNRHVIVRQFFDAKMAKIPSIHITIPSDEDGDNSLGIGQSESFGDGIVMRDYDQSGELKQHPINSRRFDTRYQIIFTSDNHSEVMILYHLVRAILISVFDTIQHVGLQNPSLSGQDLRINSELSPPHIYMRALGLKASYEVEVPQWFGTKFIEKILTQ